MMCEDTVLLSTEEAWLYHMSNDLICLEIRTEVVHFLEEKSKYGQKKSLSLFYSHLVRSKK